MRGQWKSEEFLQRAIGGPKPAGVPMLWKWGEVTSMLDEAGRVMPDSLQARRSLIFQNPGLARGTTHTINMGVQMIQPGETAWAHRHSIAALRFVIKGSSGLSTVVNGEPCSMQDYDLVLTPNWAWHDHHNNSNQSGFWLDEAGGPTLPTLACQAQSLPGGFATRNRRRTSSAVYFVVRGEGTTTVDGKELNWSENDCFAVPNWTWHQHVNRSPSQDTILFSVHDTPVLKTLGLYREESKD
jgi:gentisate 1,2-dioxygenase